MNRTTTLQLAGKQYPLNFSVAAARQIDERYGGMEKLSQAFDGGSIGRMMGTLSDVMYLLMQQGAAYEKLVNGREVELPTAEELDVLMGMQDFAVIQKTLFEAMGVGAKATVEVAPDAKNADATRGA